MRLISGAVRRSVIRGIVVRSVGALSVLPFAPLRAQSPAVAARPNVRLRDETAGLGAIVQALIAAFDQVDVVALGEAHERRVDSDLRIALVRHPDFAKRVRFVVIECGSTSEQATLDRYIRGQNVSKTQLERVWKTTTQAASGFCDAPVYAAFLAAIRDVNSRLPSGARLRVFGGDPGPGDNRSRETAAISILKEQVFQTHAKALLIYGAAHFYLTGPTDYLSSLGADIGLARRLAIDYPGRTLTVIPIGGLNRPSAVEADIDPDYRKFDRALTTPVRPVLLSLRRLPFRDFTAEEFLGRTLTTCRGTGGCRSVFKGSSLTLGQMADACLYVGRDAEAAAQAAQPRSMKRRALSSVKGAPWQRHR